MPFSNDTRPALPHSDVVSLHQGGARRVLLPRPRNRRHVPARKQSIKHPLRVAVVVRAPQVPHIVVTPPPPPAEEDPGCNRAPAPQNAAFGMLLTVPDPETPVVNLNPAPTADDDADADVEPDLGHTWSG